MWSLRVPPLTRQPRYGSGHPTTVHETIGKLTRHVKWLPASCKTMETQSNHLKLHITIHKTDVGGDDIK